MAKPDGGPAFPTVHEACPGCGIGRHGEGMSLRDHFAGQALAGLSVPNPRDDSPEAWAWDAFAQAAYMAADAMLAERDRE